MERYSIWDYYAAWAHAEYRGEADAWGGAECRRRHAEWQRAGCPEPGQWLAGGDPLARPPTQGQPGTHLSAAERAELLAEDLADPSAHELGG